MEIGVNGEPGQNVTQDYRQGRGNAILHQAVKYQTVPDHQHNPSSVVPQSMATGDSGQLGAPVFLDDEHAPGDVTTLHLPMEEKILHKVVIIHTALDHQQNPSSVVPQ